MQWSDITGLLKSAYDDPLGTAGHGADKALQLLTSRPVLEAAAGGALASLSPNNPDVINRYWEGIKKGRSRKQLQAFAKSLGIEGAESMPFDSMQEVLGMLPQYQVAPTGQVLEKPLGKPPKVVEGIPNLAKPTTPRPFSPPAGAKGMYVPGSGWQDIPENERTPYKPRAMEGAKEPLPNSKADLQRRYAAGEKLTDRQMEILGVMGDSGGGTGASIGDALAPGRPVNEAAFAGVSPQMASTVKQLADYKIPFPSGVALKTPYWQRVIDLAGRYDPSFDATQYGTRVGVRRDFTSGPTSKALGSANKAIHHLRTLREKGRLLNNYSNPMVNWGANLAKQQRGKDVVNNFNTARDAVAMELTKFFRGTGGNKSDIDSWKSVLSPNASPEQIEGAIHTALDLFDGQIQSLQDRYERGMGRPLDFKLLSPDSEAILSELRGGGGSTAPAVGTVEDGHRFNGGDPGDPASWTPVQ